MASTSIILNKNGTKSLRVQHYDKDINNWGKSKIYPKSFLVPNTVKGKKDLEAFKTECEVKWRKEVQQKIEDAKRKKITVTAEMSFAQYAEKSLEETMRMGKLVTYSTNKGRLAVLNKHFGEMSLNEITKSEIQRRFDRISETVIERPSAKIKEGFKAVIDGKIRKIKDFCSQINMQRTTLSAARRGERVSLDTAERICDALNIDINKHFDVQHEPRYYSKETVKGYFRVFRAILGQAESEGLITKNPAYGKNAVKIKVREVETAVSEDKVLNSEEFQRFQNVLTSNIDNAILQFTKGSNGTDHYVMVKNTMFLVAMHTGLRKGELCGLEWRDIDLVNRKLKVRQNVVYVREFGVQTGEPKTKGSKRTISIPKILCEYLEKYKAWWDKETAELGITSRFLFNNENGNVVCPCTPSHWLRQMLKANGFKHLGLHGLRHTHATILISIGTDVKTVSARLGHADPIITLKVYTHFIPRNDEMAADKLDEMFKMI